MAVNAVYPKFLLRLPTLGDPTALDYYAQCVDGTATFNRTHDQPADLTAVLLGDPVAIGGPTWAVTTAGVELGYDGDPIDVDSLDNDDEVGGLIVYCDDGTNLWLVTWVGRRYDSSPLAGTSDGSTAPLSWPDGVILTLAS